MKHIYLEVNTVLHSTEVDARTAVWVWVQTQTEPHVVSFNKELYPYCCISTGWSQEMDSYRTFLQ